MIVIKRDGREKPFESGRIKEAIRKAYLDVYNGSEEEFTDEYEYIITLILDDLTDIKDNKITIEQIQDTIVSTLMEVNPEYRAVLKPAGLVTRDPRAKERKKYGLKKARKSSQFSKR